MRPDEIVLENRLVMRDAIAEPSNRIHPAMHRFPGLSTLRAKCLMERPAP
jgi:hypothetical protein